MKVICCTWLLLRFLQPLYAQLPVPDDSLQTIVQQYKITGLSVAVVKKNKIVYTRALGMQDLETKKPLREQNLFRIASISKSFTATSLLQLVKAGKISLEDDISSLAGFRIRHPKFPETVITLRLLLSHQSSLNDSQGYFSLDVINPEKNRDWEKCYNAYEPGKGYQYCNLNFNLAGTILERISGERFDQYVKKHILDPLGLYGGYCVDSLDNSLFTTLYEYNRDSARFIPQPNAYHPRREELASYFRGYSTPVFSPTGGMKISARDLATYMCMHMNYGSYKGKRIIPRRLSKQMQTPLSEKENYGLALHQTEKLINGERLTGHTGSAYGLNSAMFFHPKKKWGIVVFISGSQAGYTNGYHNAIRDLVNILYREILK